MSSGTCTHFQITYTDYVPLLVNWKPTNRTELQVQDNGRTLKVFVTQGN